MDCNELQKFIDEQNFESIGIDEISKILNNVVESAPIKNINLQYQRDSDMHFALVNFRDSSGTRCRGAFQLNLSQLAQQICDRLDEIQDELIAIDQFNALVRDQLYKNSNQFNVSYCWGSNDRCSVEDWQYQHIKIKLSKDQCENLRAAMKDDQLASTIQSKISENDFGQNAADTITNFDSMPVHQEIGAILFTSQVEKALTENMLQVEDAMRVVRQSQYKQGIQHIKLVVPFNELGQFLIAVDWEVNYSDKDIKQKIMEEKLLDIENRKYILDSQIYNRVEKRISLPDEMIQQMFN